MNMAFYLYPEIFLEFSDKYTSTLLHYLKKDYKNILVFTGHGQSDALMDYMEYRTI